MSQMEAKNNRYCGTCYYFGWKRLDKWCRHPDHVEEMRGAGVDFFTTGNHIWGNNAGVMQLNDPKFPVIRPANYPSENTPGRGYQIIEDGMMNRLLVVNMMGLVFMKEDLDHPFRVIDRIIQENAHENLAGIFVDVREIEEKQHDYYDNFFDMVGIKANGTQFEKRYFKTISFYDLWFPSP